MGFEFFSSRNPDLGHWIEESRKINSNTYDPRTLSVDSLVLVDTNNDLNLRGLLVFQFFGMRDVEDIDSDLVHCGIPFGASHTGLLEHLGYSRETPIRKVFNTIHIQNHERWAAKRMWHHLLSDQYQDPTVMSIESDKAAAEKLVRLTGAKVLEIKSPGHNYLSIVASHR